MVTAGRLIHCEHTADRPLFFRPLPVCAGHSSSRRPRIPMQALSGFSHWCRPDDCFSRVVIAGTDQHCHPYFSALGSDSGRRALSFGTSRRRPAERKTHGVCPHSRRSSGILLLGRGHCTHLVPRAACNVLELEAGKKDAGTGSAAKHVAFSRCCREY